MLCELGGSLHSSRPQHRPAHEQRPFVNSDWTAEGHASQGEHGCRQWTEDTGDAD